MKKPTLLKPDNTQFRKSKNESRK